MRQFLFSALFLTFTAISFSQNALRDDLNGVYYDPTLYMQQYEVEDGSPYLDLAFRPAKIGDREKTYLVRFNGYKGNIEVWVKENQVIVLETSAEEQIKLLDGSDKNYVLKKYKNKKGGVNSGYLEVIASSDAYTLYKKEIIKYFKKTKAEGYAPAKPARFEKGNPQFYLKSPENTMPIYLPTSKKKFLTFFSSKTAAKAKNFIKKERLSLGKEEDIIQILNDIYGN